MGSCPNSMEKKKTVQKAVPKMLFLRKIEHQKQRKPQRSITEVIWLCGFYV